LPLAKFSASREQAPAGVARNELLGNESFEHAGRKKTEQDIGGRLVKQFPAFNKDFIENRHDY
jgi:hypothetical protein